MQLPGCWKAPRPHRTSSQLSRATALMVVLAEEGGHGVSCTEGAAGKRPEGLGKHAPGALCA